jgi:vacuolar-type H+-ATPase subunit C/Vma6
MRVRTAVAGIEPHDPPLAGKIPYDPDRLTAGLHGRRSRMAEGDRLIRLCRIQTLPELARTVFPGTAAESILDFQRLAVRELARELIDLITCMSGPGARLLYWLLIRFQIENLKVLIRMRLSGRPETAQVYLVPLPKGLTLDVRGLSAAESFNDFIDCTPKGLLREALKRASEIYPVRTSPFFFEAMLDRDYFQVLLEAVEEIREQDKDIAKPMFLQEVDTFLLMLLLRGKYFYGLDRETLLPLHVRGTRIPRALFATMLDDQDLRESVERVAQSVFDVPPFQGTTSVGSSAPAIDAAALEHLAWKRFGRLANLAFRKSHIGLAAVLGYAGIRRLEVANLVTLSEGIQKAMTAEAIRDRLIAHWDSEALSV